MPRSAWFATGGLREVTLSSFLLHNLEHITRDAERVLPSTIPTSSSVFSLPNSGEHVLEIDASCVDGFSERCEVEFEPAYDCACVVPDHYPAANDQAGLLDSATRCIPENGDTAVNSNCLALITKITPATYLSRHGASSCIEHARTLRMTQSVEESIRSSMHSIDERNEAVNDFGNQAVSEGRPNK
jgi:hypothetical protein